MLTQTTKDIALATFVGMTKNPANRRRHPRRMIEDAFTEADAYVRAENAYDARQRDIAPADNARPKPSPVDVQLWDPFMSRPKVDDDGKPVMVTVAPDLGAYPAGLPFFHHHVQSHLRGKLELGLPLPSCIFSIDQKVEIKNMAAEIGVPNPFAAEFE